MIFNGYLCEYLKGLFSDVRKLYYFSMLKYFCLYCLVICSRQAVFKECFMYCIWILHLNFINYRMVVFIYIIQSRTTVYDCVVMFLHGDYSEAYYRCVDNLAKRISEVPRNKSDLNAF